AVRSSAKVHTGSRSIWQHRLPRPVFFELRPTNPFYFGRPPLKLPPRRRTVASRFRKRASRRTTELSFTVYHAHTALAMEFKGKPSRSDGAHRPCPISWPAR